MNVQSLKMGLNTKTFYSFPADSKKYMDKMGFYKSNYHDKQAVGLVLPANTALKIRQMNTNLETDVTIEFLNNDSQQENLLTVPKSGQWVTLTHGYLSIPFITTPYVNTHEEFVLEFEITSTMTELPSYSIQGNELEFFQYWDQKESEFAVIMSNRVQMLIPKADKESLRKMSDFPSIDALLNHYEQMVKTYDYLVGISETDSSPIHRTHTTKYFVKANAHGAGAAYYSLSHTAANAATLAWFYIEKGWGANHEFGHGYQGSFMNSEAMQLGEVWNNMYAHTFERTYLAEEAGWLYNGNRLIVEQGVFDKRVIERNGFNQLSLRHRLYFFIALKEKIGDIPFIYFNRKYRELANAEQTDNVRNADILALLLSEGAGRNLTPYFESYYIQINDETKEKTSKYENLIVLKDVVNTEEKANEIKDKWGLPSPYSLVSTSELEKELIVGEVNITFTIDDVDQIKNKSIIVKSGSTEITRTLITGLTFTLKDVPVGAYTLVVPNGTTRAYEIKNPTLTIQENKITNQQITYTPLSKGIGTKVTIQLLGLGDDKFGRIDLDLVHQKVTILISGQPHSYFLTPYSKVEIIKPTGDVVYSKEFIGNQSYELENQVTIGLNYTIKVYHEEPNRLKVFDTILNTFMDVVNTSNKTNEFILTDYGIKNVTSSEDLSKTFVDKINQFSNKIRNDLTPEEINDKDRFKNIRNILFAAIRTLDEGQRNMFLLKNKDILDSSWTKQVSEYFLNFLGLGNWNFANLNIFSKDRKLNVAIKAGKPHSYFTDTYAKIIVLDENEQVIYSKNLVGNIENIASSDTVNFKEGYTIMIHHEEPSRLQVMDVSVNTFIPVNKDNKLVMLNNKLVPVNYSFKFLGLGDWNFVNLNIFPKDNQLNVIIKAGKPHSYFTNTYAQIIVLDENEQVIYSKNLVGNIENVASSDTVTFKEGYTIMIHHEEPNRLKVMDMNTNTFISVNKDNSFVIQDEKLIRQ